jgi:CYTH domain-containing protein
LTSSKYARVERERRFLLSAFPEGVRIERTRRIADRYFPGTDLRLRLMDEVVDGEHRLEYKLTQKLSANLGDPPRSLNTNLYLSPTAHDLLSRLPGDDLSKIRHSTPPLGVDVFEPPLEGLILAEAEFDTDSEMASFRPPEFVLAEVTHDPRFTGARLARTDRRQLRAMLAEFGVRIDLD